MRDVVDVSAYDELVHDVAIVLVVQLAPRDRLLEQALVGRHPLEAVVQEVAVQLVAEQPSTLPKAVLVVNPRATSRDLNRATLPTSSPAQMCEFVRAELEQCFQLLLVST